MGYFIIWMKRIWVNITLRIISSHLIATEMRTYLKSIACFLITLILFQSCVSAKSVTVDKAVLQERNVQIKTAEGETYRYKKLIRRDSILYGVKRVQGVGLVELDRSNLNIIEVKYYSYPVVLVVVSVVGLVFIINIIDFWINGL